MGLLSQLSLHQLILMNQAKDILVRRSYLLSRHASFASIVNRSYHYQRGAVMSNANRIQKAALLVRT